MMMKLPKTKQHIVQTTIIKLQNNLGYWSLKGKFKSIASFGRSLFIDIPIFDFIEIKYIILLALCYLWE